ncbi:YaaA family protein [Cryobacterium fucosi]|uniref:Peroxide stress protein YaaA n=1 Tax=Cryobacterium fucosi TaxID=1259157 RepID=A0A4R9BCQ6_9MICO|nr:peroxide stress protein YaaA [Cryobacterium fucosi]TFD81137.1 peroxide stress protein YaaA [Cryobacterium fucosi]
MLVLLPPSETKRLGGTGEPLDLRTLTYPSLHSSRRVLVRALVGLAKHPDAMMAALKLGRTQAGEIGRNRTLATSATMPVLDRYTGVLYDALDAATLTSAGRAWAGEHVRVHSALFGPVGALDLIPAYRLSHDSRLPDLPLKKHWSGPVEKALRGTDGLLLDLRSAGYAALGPAPVRADSLFLRVVTQASDGRTRALNHFNKTAKGAFSRALIEHAESFDGVIALLDWAESAGFTLRPGAAGEVDLVVDQLVGASQA